MPRVILDGPEATCSSSRARVQAVLEGQLLGEQPVFDVICNDEVLAAFGRSPIACDDEPAALASISAAVDGTRWSQFGPREARVEKLPDGRRRWRQRWHAWSEAKCFSSVEAYRAQKSRTLAVPIEALPRQDPVFLRDCALISRFGEQCFYPLHASGPGLGELVEEVGLELFAECLVDAEGTVVALLERQTHYAVQWLERLPEPLPVRAVFIGEDIACKSGALFNPRWLRRHFYPRLARVVDAAHRRGLRVIFHSDGDVSGLLDDLADTGIDALNPLEGVTALQLERWHRRYPSLVFIGGIDGRWLLPFGQPLEIERAVYQAIDACEGKILVGSSTEISAAVPLSNFMAMKRAAARGPAH